jgi:hypothetical protein
MYVCIYTYSDRGHLRTKLKFGPFVRQFDGIHGIENELNGTFTSVHT